MKVVFIGAGYMIREHLKAFQGLPGVEFSGIYSRTKTKAKALAGEFNISVVCNSVDELYAKTKADLVIIAVPVLKTLETIVAAIQYPWIQLIEKPVGTNVEEAQIILDLFKSSSRTGFAAFNRRFYSSTHTVLLDKDISSSSRLICVYDQEDPWATWEEERSRELINNWMFANSIHLIDYFRFLGRGKIISVEPVIRWNPEKPFAVLAKLTYDSGDLGVYQAIWGAPGPWAVTVTSKEKRWELRPLEIATSQMYGTRNFEKAPIDQIDVEYKAGLRMQAKEAIKAVNGEPHALVTLDDSLETMKLVKLIYAV